MNFIYICTYTDAVFLVFLLRVCGALDSLIFAHFELPWRVPTLLQKINLLNSLFKGGHRNKCLFKFDKLLYNALRRQNLFVYVSKSKHKNSKAKHSNFQINKLHISFATIGHNYPCSFRFIWTEYTQIAVIATLNRRLREKVAKNCKLTTV